MNTVPNNSHFKLWALIKSFHDCFDLFRLFIILSRGIEPEQCPSTPECFFLKDERPYYHFIQFWPRPSFRWESYSSSKAHKTVTWSQLKLIFKVDRSRSTERPREGISEVANNIYSHKLSESVPHAQIVPMRTLVQDIGRLSRSCLKWPRKVIKVTVLTLESTLLV